MAERSCGSAPFFSDYAGISPAATSTGLGDTIKDYIYAQTHQKAAVGAGVFEKIGNAAGNFGRAAGFYLQMFLPWVMMKAVGVVINITCWSRAIEILVLASFSPLAFADIMDPSNVSSSAGMRFIKNFFALSLTSCGLQFIFFRKILQK